jgi:hypothetical protein
VADCSQAIQIKPDLAEAITTEVTLSPINANLIRLSLITPRRCASSLILWPLTSAALTPLWTSESLTRRLATTQRRFGSSLILRRSTLAAASLILI